MRTKGGAMNAPGMIEVPVLAVEPDGRKHEVARLVYVLEEESRVAELEAENGKLRELVGIMHRYAVKECIGCTHRASGTCDGCAIIGYERRMNELGIGVEE